jgi:papain fold toxin 1 (glutamine deamidase) of polymorphic toxin system
MGGETSGLERDFITRLKVQLGIGDVRDSEFAIVNQNRYWNNIPGGRENCVYCSWAGDEILAGRPARAETHHKGLAPEITMARFGRTFRQISGGRKSAINQIEQLLIAFGPGSRGIVADGGHQWNVINDNGTVRWIDFQRNLEGRGIVPSSRGGYNFMRTDDVPEARPASRGVIYL